MESARLGRLDDLEAIAAIARRACDELIQLRGGELFLAREAPVSSWAGRIRGAIEQDDAVVVVGAYDGVVLGYGVAMIEQLPDGRLLGVLEELTVEPEARGSGIGEAMMDLVLVQLQAAGCIGVDSRALPGDRETKNFFESYGLKARLLTVHRSFE
jgi:ribosomal protein S18 acetylase RimI-like enzyme